MSDQQIDHGAVAAITVVGAFAVVIMSQATHEPLSPALSTLVIGSVGTVIGFFFGSRGSQAGQEAIHAALTTVAGLLQQQSPQAEAAPPVPDVAPAPSVRTEE